MGHIFQAECWEKHLSGCSFSFIMAKEIGKVINKGKDALIDIYLWK